MTGQLADLLCRYLEDGAVWESHAEVNAPHEANYLRLDCSRLKTALGWRPRWDISRAVEETVVWTKTWLAGDNTRNCMERQIAEYVEG